MSNLQPKKEHKFTFGLWTVGNPGRDAFGEPARSPISPKQIVKRLSELGAYGVNFHDNDILQIDPSQAKRDKIVREFKKVLVDDDMAVPITVNDCMHPEERFNNSANNKQPAAHVPNGVLSGVVPRLEERLYGYFANLIKKIGGKCQLLRRHSGSYRPLEDDGRPTESARIAYKARSKAVDRHKLKRGKERGLLTSILQLVEEAAYITCWLFIHSGLNKIFVWLEPVVTEKMMFKITFVILDVSAFIIAMTLVFKHAREHILSCSNQKEKVRMNRVYPPSAS